MAGNPIKYLHAGRGEGSFNPRWGIRVVQLLQQASADNVRRADQLLKLISSNLWQVKEHKPSAIVVTLHYGKSSFRPDWRIAVKNGKASQVQEVGEVEEVSEMELATPPAQVTGAF